MCRSVMLLVAVGTLGTLLGCGKTDPRGERIAVRGAVLLDGKPLKRARVVFEATGEEKIRATASVVDGFYEIPAERGPLAGQHVVRIEPEPLDLGEFEMVRRNRPVSMINPHVVAIPERYNTKSDLEVTVSADSRANKFDFELASKPKNQTRTGTTRTRP